MMQRSALFFGAFLLFSAYVWTMEDEDNLFLASAFGENMLMRLNTPTVGNYCYAELFERKATSEGFGCEKWGTIKITKHREIDVENSFRSHELFTFKLLDGFLSKNKGLSNRMKEKLGRSTLIASREVNKKQYHLSAYYRGNKNNGNTNYVMAKKTCTYDAHIGTQRNSFLLPKIIRWFFNNKIKINRRYCWPISIPHEYSRHNHSFEKIVKTEHLIEKLWGQLIVCGIRVARCLREKGIIPKPNAQAAQAIPRKRVGPWQAVQIGDCSGLKIEANHQGGYFLTACSIIATVGVRMRARVEKALTQNAHLFSFTYIDGRFAANEEKNKHIQRWLENSCFFVRNLAQQYVILDVYHFQKKVPTGTTYMHATEQVRITAHELFDIKSALASCFRPFYNKTRTTKTLIVPSTVELLQRIKKIPNIAFYPFLYGKSGCILL